MSIRQYITRELKFAMACVWATTVFATLPSLAIAQGLPQVITLNTGVQYEGEAFTVGAIRGALDPRGNKMIAVVDDGKRWIHFTNDASGDNRRILRISDSERNESEIAIWQRTMEPSITNGYGVLRYVGPFDKFGTRLIRYQDADGVWEVVQGVTLLNPRWSELRSLKNPDTKRKRNWTMRVSTNIIPPDVLRNLLRSQIKKEDDEAEYLNIVDFYVQAEQFSQAERELTFILRKFPHLKDRIKNYRQIIRQALAQQLLRTTRDHLEAGQPVLGSQMLAALGTEGLSSEIQAEVKDLRRQLINNDEFVVQTKKMVNDLVNKTVESGDLDDEQTKILQRFQAEVTELATQSNAPRFDAVRRFMNDAEMTLLEKSSLAISGWLLGSNFADANFAVTISLYPVRDLIREYLSTADRARRSRIVVELAGFEGGAPQYVARVIAQMLPPNPPADLAAYTGEKPIEFTVSVKGSRARPEPREYKCHVHLPPEYDPNRRYPCIIALPNNRNLDQQMSRWCGQYNPKLEVRTGQATRHGYIVVGVDWKLPNQTVYGYTKREHAVVLKAYREALRMFAIDTDRVFLAGHGVGGDMAYDIGISHPDKWAGVIGISGKIAKYAFLYNDNRHVRMPIYSVMGEKDLDSLELSQASLNKWLVSRNFLESTLVICKGRANEPFVEEIVGIFKWAQAQKRKLPEASGFEFDVQAHRPWDRSFWFWEIHGIPYDSVEWPQYWKDRGHPTPVGISGMLKDNQPNHFFLGPNKRCAGGTLWLSPEFVDFSKNITISGRGKAKIAVSPSTRVILEDVRRRADRQHPFWAKLECRGTAWEKVE